ncbi:MAG: EAL domain-containing protein [Alphaproteobacteria bacterium]|nr:EAL domain-containing protein [Alphaproteobacteria bacterium]
MSLERTGSDQANGAAILIVDDTPENLVFLAAVLRKAGYQVRSVLNGRLALQTAASNPPDLVLLDVLMPEMDGYELCRRLKADPKLKRIPVIFISAATDSEVKVKAFTSGGVDFIVKPFESEEVLARVRTHLALSAVERELERRLRERTQDLEKANEQTVKERTLLRTLIDAIPDLVFFKDPQSVYLGCNRALEAYFGHPEAEIVGHSDSDFIDAETAAAFRAEDVRLLASGGRRTQEVTLVYPDGRRAVVETIKTLIPGPDGVPAGLVGVSRDITQRKSAEVTLRLAASVFEHANEGIIITDGTGTIIDVNRAFSTLTGYTHEEVVGRKPSLLKSGHQERAFYEEMWRCLLATGAWQGEVWNRRKSGEVYAEFLTISAVRDEQGTCSRYIGLFSDITPMKMHQERLERLAHYDALTQLPNRALLADRLQVAIEHARRDVTLLAVVFLDLDGFKAVNDSFGHDAGDTLLIEVGERLRTCVRGSDTVARLGGDEFVLLFGGIDSVIECQRALERVLNAIATPFELKGRPVRITASVGVTLYPLDGAEAEVLLRHADLAMYAAKQAGRNRYHLFDPERDQRAHSYRQKLRRIELAIAAEEFVVYYQPQVEMDCHRVVGVEALVRWQNPELGLLLPDEFLPDIQETELIIGLGDWILDHVLTQMEHWHGAGFDVPVSVNIAAYQLLDPCFLAKLTAALASHPDIRGDRLQLEIVETTALKDIDVASRVIADCGKLGVAFALDDFGTGYSSLLSLKRLPARFLKIDQSFVSDMLEPPESFAIVQGVIGLARAFNREVIAEGVERPEHEAILLQLGCRLGQGFGIAHPMPASELVPWVEAYEGSAGSVRTG